jgi:cell wall-associated NlpC family hydrolase
MRLGGKLILGGIVVAGIALITVGGTSGIGASESTIPPSSAAVSDIPRPLLPVYQAAARTCPGESWTLLAGIGKTESDHGRSKLPGVTSGANSKGAEGPMQFLPGTWAAFGVDGNHDGVADVYNPTDAIFGAARYLCSNGAGQPGTVREALWAYNHSTAYANTVLATAESYGSSAQSGLTEQVRATGSAAALTAVRYADNYLGVPYVWGGDSPRGFDCSGLTSAAYKSAGVTIPRTANAQYRTFGILKEPSRIGDLVFFGTPSFVHHVGIYIGSGQMIDAPTEGETVRVEPYRESDYLAAGRPG